MSIDKNSFECKESKKHLDPTEELRLTKFILDKLETGYADLNFKKNEAYLSSSFKALLGFKDEELCGEINLLEKLIHEDDLPQVLLNLTDHFATKGHTRYDHVVRHYKSNGDVLFLRSIGKVVSWDEEDAPIRMVMTFQKVPESSGNNSLDNQTQKFKETIQNDIGHEMVTSLTTILGFSELLQGSDLDRIQSEHLKNLRQAAENVEWLIKDLLEFSIETKDDLLLEKYPMNLLEIIYAATDIAQRTMLHKKVQINTSILGGMPEAVIGDSRHLVKLIIQLCRNTIEFHQSGTIELEVKTSGVVDGKTNVKFTFSFIGSGDDVSNIHNIFKAFSRDNLNNGKFTGKGRGLVYAQKVVNAHDSISSSRILENGIAEFSFEISYLVTTKPSMPLFTGDKIAENQTLKGIEVLLVEDDEMSMMLAKKHLLSFGASVDVAVNGEECISMVSRKAYNLILMDIMMSDMDGIETSRKLREELKIETPIFALTAKSSLGNRVECIKAGMNYFISKPFTSKTLMSRIMQALDIEIPTIKYRKTLQDSDEDIFTFSNVTDRLDELRQSEGAEFVDVLIKIFNKNIRKDKDELKEFVKNRNYIKIGNKAHKMAGSLIVMKFVSEYKLALSICNDIKSEHYSKVETNSSLLIDALEKLEIQTSEFL